MKSKIIIACDFDSKIKFDNFFKTFKNENVIWKIGLQAFTGYGFEMFHFHNWKNKKIFFDMKYFDTPRTIIATIDIFLKKYSLILNSIYSITLSFFVGEKTLKIIKTKYPKIKLWGVGPLTSFSNKEWNELITCKKINNYYLDVLKKLPSLDGVVCSSSEANDIKKQYPDLETIVPGIRINEKNFDQKRITNFVDIKTNDYIDYFVIGREITLNKNPLALIEKLKNILE